MDLFGMDLIELARSARENAYAPYSKFKVGAAVLMASGEAYSGCNIENAAYGLSNCAERTAIFKAVSAGEHAFVQIVIIADTPHPTAPCGACRQVIAEFGIPEITMVNLRGETKTVTLEELLPFSFSKADLVE